MTRIQVEVAALRGRLEQLEALQALVCEGWSEFVFSCLIEDGYYTTTVYVFHPSISLEKWRGVEEFTSGSGREYGPSDKVKIRGDGTADEAFFRAWLGVVPPDKYKSCNLY